MRTDGAYFDCDGQPLPEAAPFLEYRFGCDEPEPGPEMRARWDAVRGRHGIFDDDLILQSLVEGWSVDETLLRGLEVEADLSADPVATVELENEDRRQHARG